MVVELAVDTSFEQDPVAACCPGPAHQYGLGLALAALLHSGAGATATGSQAAANLAAATQKEIEMAKLATALVTGGLLEVARIDVLVTVVG